MSRFPLNHPLKSLAAVSVVAIAASFWWNSREIAVETERPVEDAVQDDKTLALKLRKRIWDIEHFAFLVETEVFPTWKAALAKGKPTRLAEYLATDFVGRVCNKPLNDVLTDGPLAVQSTQRPRTGGRTVDAGEFLQALFAFRRLLDPGSDSCRLKIGLVRFGPKKPGDLHGPWQCVWRIRMAGTRKNAPVEVVLDLSLTVDPLDEKIGSRKRWIRIAAIDRVVVSRSTKFLMQETTKTSGIPVERLHDNWRHAAKEFRTKTGGVYLSDFDRDGVLDVLVEDIDAGTRLYRGLGKGRFEDVTEKSGLPVHTLDSTPPWTGCCWADLDGDGDEDLILQDKLFENRGDGTFADVTKKSNLILTPTAGYAVADYDRDGKVDLYVCHSGKYLIGQQLNEKTPWIDGGLGINNVLWRNLGNWQFEDVTRETNAGGDGSACFAAVWFDANNDRWPDLLAVNEFGRNSLLINRSGRFTATAIDPIFGGFSMGVTAGDVDNDGRTDVYVANMYSKAGNRIMSNLDPSAYRPGLYEKLLAATTGNKLYRSRGDGGFDVLSGSRIAADVGWAYGPCFVDFNMDGRLDIYATAGFRSIQRGKPDG